MTGIPEPKKKTFIFSHLGMGDNIICNGMVRTLADNGEPWAFVCKCCYVNAVRAMFEDLPNVEVFGTLSDQETFDRWLTAIPGGVRLGIFSQSGFNPRKFDSEFYRQAGVPFTHRWSRFKLPDRLLKVAPAAGEYLLMHEDEPRKFLLDRSRLPQNLEVRVITARPSFWDWLPEIYGAKELHLIDSGYLNLVDSLWSIGALPKTRLVWHQYARRYVPGGGNIPKTKAPWELLK